MIPLSRLHKLSNKSLVHFLNAHGQKEYRIYSKEHSAYWRPNNRGYAIQRHEAGVYTLAEAFWNTVHCGPEKEIFFERVGIIPIEEMTIMEFAEKAGQILSTPQTFTITYNRADFITEKEWDSFINYLKTNTKIVISCTQ